MRIIIDNKKNRLDQWDTGQRLILEDIPAGTHVDFVHKGAETLGRETYEEGDQVYVDIPDAALQTAGPMAVYFYVQDGDRGETVWCSTPTVWPRPKPADYIYTDEEKKTWEDLQEQIDDLREKGTGGGGSAVATYDPETGELTITGTGVSYDAETGELTI